MSETEQWKERAQVAEALLAAAQSRVQELEQQVAIMQAELGDEEDKTPKMKPGGCADSGRKDDTAWLEGQQFDPGEMTRFLDAVLDSRTPQHIVNMVRSIAESERIARGRPVDEDAFFRARVEQSLEGQQDIVLIVVDVRTGQRWHQIIEKRRMQQDGDGYADFIAANLRREFQASGDRLRSLYQVVAKALEPLLRAGPAGQGPYGF